MYLQSNSKAHAIITFASTNPNNKIKVATKVNINKNSFLDEEKQTTNQLLSC